MPSERDLLDDLYESFNARDMEAALAAMHRDVVWANGLDGGYVYGREGVRQYWTRQWKTMKALANPLNFSAADDGTTCVEVHVTARDLNGSLLFDKSATHVFRIEDGLIVRFDIRESNV
jgi:hypothetical protein